MEQKLEDMKSHHEYLKRFNVLNEIFKIDPELYMISGYILGSKSNAQDWEETSAALGQICLLLKVLIKKHRAKEKFLDIEVKGP